MRWWLGEQTGRWVLHCWGTEPGTSPPAALGWHHNVPTQNSSDSQHPSAGRESMQISGIALRRVGKELGQHQIYNNDVLEENN